VGVGFGFGVGPNPNPNPNPNPVFISKSDDKNFANPSFYKKVRKLNEL